MRDMAYYGAQEGFPPHLFCPDGSYPVINTEKGRVQMTVQAPCVDPRLIWAEGGEAVNAIPTEARALVREVPREEMLRAAGQTGHSLTCEEQPEGMLLTVHGAAAHASTPEKGRNAVTALLEVLYVLGIGGEPVAAAACTFPFDEYGGQAMGAACRDEVSGAMTLALTRLRVREGKLTGQADIRFPVSYTVEQIRQRLQAGVPALFAVSFDHAVPGHHVPADDPFVRTLLRVYEQQTGQRGECLAIGGGTYAHDIPGGVAFGAAFPDVDNHMHGTDEYISLEELAANARIMAHAVVEICGCHQ